jgi:hypothetical protein
MPQVPFTAFFLGPAAVYPITTGQQDPITGAAYLGTDLLEGNYTDLSAEDALQWNYTFGGAYRAGRYRFVKVQTNANAANLAIGAPVGWGQNVNVGSVVIANAGSGYTPGAYTCSSTYNIGSQSPAVIAVTIGTGGTITAATLVQGGGPFLATPTFGLTELPAGSSGSILAQLLQSTSIVTSFDSTAVSTSSLVRGICLTAALTTSLITAGAWIVVQEEGIASVLVTTATGTTAGSQLTVASGGAVTSASSPAYSAVEVGFALAKPAAATLVPTRLTIPVIEG